MQIFSLLSHEEILTTLGKKIKDRRKHLKLSRAELSDKSGVSVPTIVRIESDGNTSFSNLIKIATALGALNDFESLFNAPKAKSLDEFIKNYS